MSDALNKDDLYNMFKSYEINVKYNIQLYDRQEILVKEQEKVLQGIKEVTEKQADIFRQIDALFKTINENNTSCKTNIVDATVSLKKVSEQLTDLTLLNVKEHGNIKTNLMVISVGLSSVVIALIIALGKIWEKSYIIDAVAKFIGAKP